MFACDFVGSRAVGWLVSWLVVGCVFFGCFFFVVVVAGGGGGGDGDGGDGAGLVAVAVAGVAAVLPVCCLRVERGFGSLDYAQLHQTPSIWNRELLISTVMCVLPK